MTINGAIMELVMLRENPDMPYYLKASLDKVIETISEAELVEPKDEPQTNADQHVQRVEYVGNDEKSRCWTCKHFERMHETPISSDGSYYTYVVCTAKECNYEPKDEPTISKMEQVDKDINVRSKTEPQTERSKE